VRSRIVRPAAIGTQHRRGFTKVPVANSSLFESNYSSSPQHQVKQAGIKKHTNQKGGSRMKAKIISQKLYEGAMDWIHGGGYTAKRLVVEEAGNLIITSRDNQVCAFTGFNLEEDCKVIGEVEVPDELVEKALAFVRAKAEFDGLKDAFEALLG